MTGAFVVIYTVGSGSCSTSDQATVTVVPATVVDPGPDQQLCIDEPAFSLGATPVGGTWTGKRHQRRRFRPVNGRGRCACALVHLCGPERLHHQATRTIKVNPLPVVSAGNDTTFCDRPVVQTLAGYSPSGGTWSGTGVTPDGTFTPNGPDMLVFTYSFTDANNCSASDQMTVTVITITDPATAGNDTAACINSGVLQLSGAPSGGTWSGSHVDAAGAFDPAVVGTYTFTYSVGNGSCVTQDQVDVTGSIARDSHHQRGGYLRGRRPGGLRSDPGRRLVERHRYHGRGGGHFDPAVSGEGVFPVTYAFTDANGCSNSASANATVDPPSHGGLLQRPHRMLWFVFSIFG
ncbi:MAG: hypothetical protein IPO60_14595 [Flavobacteriales bacterium]|nr:hypothetical protein [Flavobacteriales bacterium]